MGGVVIFISKNLEIDKLLLPLHFDWVTAQW